MRSISDSPAGLGDTVLMGSEVQGHELCLMTLEGGPDFR